MFSFFLTTNVVFRDVFTGTRDRLFLPSDETIVSVVDRNGIADTYGTITTGKYADLPLVGIYGI